MTEHSPEYNTDGDFPVESLIPEPYLEEIPLDEPEAPIIMPGFTFSVERSLNILADSTMRRLARRALTDYSMFSGSRFRRDLPSGYSMMPTSVPERSPQSPLPERLEHENPRAYLTRVLAPKSDTAEEYRQALNSQKEQLKLLHFDDPDTLAAIERRYDVHWWTFAGEDGAPIPEGICDSVLSKEFDRSFETADETTHLSLFKEVSKDHFRRYKNEIVQYDDAVREVHTEIIEQSQAYTLLKSFAEPPEQFILQELPLTAHEKIVQETALRADIAKRHGIDIAHVESIFSGMAYREFAAGKRHIDEATSARRVSVSAPVKSDAAYDFFNAFTETGVRDQWTKRQRYTSYAEALQSYKGDYSEYGQVLREYFAQFFPEGELKDRFGLLAYMAKEAEKEPEERQPYEEALQSAVKEAIRDMDVPSSFLDASYGSISQISSMVWFRQAQIPPEMQRPKRSEIAYQSQEGMVNSHDYERLMSETIMHITEDNRTEQRRRHATLLTFVPQSDLAPLAAGHAPAFSCTMQAEHIPDGTQAWFAGYKLTSERRDANGVVEYGFIEDEHNPYEVPSISLNTYLRTDLLSKIKDMPALAAMVESSEHTLNQLSKSIHDTSVATIPESYADARVIKDGVLYTQCKGANELLVELTKDSIDTIRTVSGYVLNPDDTVVTGLGHVQTLVIHEGRQYILDPTPNGNAAISMPKPAAAPLEISDDAEERMPPTGQQTSKTTEQAPVDRQILERQRAERSVAEHPQRMRELQDRLETLVAVRFGLEPNVDKEQLYDVVLRASLSDSDPLREAIYLSMTTATDRTAISEYLAVCTSTQSTVGALKQMPAEERKVYTQVGATTLDILANSLNLIAQEYERLGRAYDLLG